MLPAMIAIVRESISESITIAFDSSTSLNVDENDSAADDADEDG